MLTVVYVYIFVFWI